MEANMQDLSKILTTLRREFSTLLGNQLEALYLYGSQARGDAQLDSDIDILVVINGEFDYGELLARTSKTVATLSLENDVVISRAFVSQERFEQERSPFLLNVRREAVSI
jgi:predicted nucleotidyltransferase